MSLYLHSNRPIRPVPSHLGYPDAVQGWLYDARIAKERMRRVHGKTKSQRWVMQTFKYEYIANVTASASNSVEPFVLLDTDVLLFCNVSELRRRFHALGTPLVVSGEGSWWPHADRSGWNPWQEQNNRNAGQRFRGYPNSGVLLATRAGVALLHHIHKAMARFPCCPVHLGANATGNDLAQFMAGANRSSSCLVEDQLCLQAALRMLKLGIDYTVDANSSLVLNLGDVNLRQEVRRHDDGTFEYLPTGTRPCILHFNGYSKGGHHKPTGNGPGMRELVPTASRCAWMPQASVNVSAQAAENCASAAG